MPSCLHLAQDEVGRPVEDAPDLADAVPGQAALEQVEDGRAAHDRPLDAELEAVLAGQLVEVLVVEGGGPLVRGHDVLAHAQGLADVGGGRLAGLDVGIGQLGDDVGLALLDHVQRVEDLDLRLPADGVVGDGLSLGQEREELRDVDAFGDEERALELVADGDEADLEVVGVPQVFALRFQDLEEPLPHRSAADQTDLVFHGSLPSRELADPSRNARAPYYHNPRRKKTGRPPREGRPGSTSSSVSSAA